MTECFLLSASFRLRSVLANLTFSDSKTAHVHVKLMLVRVLLLASVSVELCVRAMNMLISLI